MRGYIFVIALGLLFFGCTQPAPPENLTNDSVSPPIEECIGPVCGIDGNTYGTDCEAELAGIEVDYRGECMISDTCTDSDGGMEPDIPGTAQKGDGSSADGCDADGALLEYSCVDGAITQTVYDCGENRSCSEGACVAKEPEPPPENDTPPAGCQGPTEADILVASTTSLGAATYKDECIEFMVVKDYYCKNGKVEAINHECPAGYGCNQGKCEYQPFSCSETDGGMDPAVKGRTLVTKGLSVPLDETDECVDLATLKENFCNEDGTGSSQEVDCGSGSKCYLGKCVDSDCSETDDGLDIYEKGTTTMDDEEYEDYCLDDHEIREYYCYGDEIKDKLVMCGQDYICSHNMDKCIEGSIED
ncbi:MAG: hypothetical protein V1827_05375 [Candidatus Micrarchaeota archaeon]